MNNQEKQVINIFLDDSGIFSPKVNENYFVYAGYVLIGRTEREDAHRRYRTLSDAIRSGLGATGELKASALEYKHRNSLVKVLSRYESLACVVHIPRIREATKATARSRHRFKDYALKVAVKRKLETLINQGKIDATRHTELNVYIDEQHTATDGLYSLEESMREEFVNGIVNLDYGSFHRPLFEQMDIKVKFCDSSANYLIQASDLLANRMNHSFNKNKPELRRLPKLHVTTFP